MADILLLEAGTEDVLLLEAGTEDVGLLNHVLPQVVTMPTDMHTEQFQADLLDDDEND